MVFYSSNRKKTIEFAKSFAKKLKGGEILALQGNLGSGKTVFVQGLAEGLQIKERVKSPSFTLMKIYKVRRGRIRFFCHVDAYRLKKVKDFLGIGLEEWAGRSDTITAIEWANKIKKILDKRAKWIFFYYGEGEKDRLIRIFDKRFYRQYNGKI